MNIDCGQKLSGKGSAIEQGTGSFRKRAPGQIQMEFVSKDEKRAPGHASGYESARRSDKPFSVRLFAQLDDFEPDQIFPRLRPQIEERPVLRFHQLKAAIALLGEPAIDANQSVRKHSSLLPEALVNLLFRSRRKVFDHHVSLHADGFRE